MSSERSARLLAGLLAGVLSTLLLQPLEVVKSRMQARGPSEPQRTWAMVVHVWRTGGARALWAGALPSMVRLAGGIALYFLFLGETEAAVRSAFGPLSGVAAATTNFILGGLSRALAMMLFCPVTVLKTRAEVQGMQTGGGGLLSDLTHLARSEGRAGLFAGLVAALVRDVPYSGLNLLLLRWLHNVPIVAMMPAAIRSAAAGAAAASCATLLTQPADVVRTQQVLQTQKDKRAGACAVLAGIYASGGLRALYTGAPARLAQRAAQQALTWGVFELFVGGASQGG